MRKSLEDLGAGRSILLDRNGRIIAGNKTAEQAGKAGIARVIVVRTDGTELVAVQRTDLDLEQDQRAKLLAVADNRTSELGLEWDADVLRALDSEIDLSGLFDEDELAAIIRKGEGDEAGTSEATATLAERFGLPPFSVLDARLGWWQERKKAWLSLGIRSEIGRGTNSSETGGTLFHSYSGADPDFYDKKTAKEKELGRELTTAEFVAQFYEPQAAEKAYASGTSIFDPVLCEMVYRWFCPVGGQVLDPFAGGSVRGIVASRLGCRYVGIDLRAEQIEANREQAARIAKAPEPVWIAGDSRNIAEVCPDVQADLVFSSPPYADLERYSDDPRDLSTMQYTEFLEVYRAIIAACVRKLKPNRFCCFVVGDVRDGNGFYRGFVADTILAFEAAGAHLYNEAIFITPAGSLPIRAGKPFATARKLGKTHQNVLIFYRGDPKAIATEFPAEIEFGSLEDVEDDHA